MKSSQALLAALSWLLMLFVFSGNAIAAEKIFIKEYTYQASEADSKLTSRAQALEQAKRLVLEELGTYLMSETAVADFKISSDRIVTLTGGIVQTEIFDEKWNGEQYYLKARIIADPDDVARAINIMRNDAAKTKELEDSRKRADDALMEIEKLKAELETLKNDKAKQIAYVKKVEVLSASAWFDRGSSYQNSGDTQNAIDAYTKAIELDPYYYEAKYNRGLLYYYKGRYEEAIEDYTGSIYLKPNEIRSYNNRGLAYSSIGQYDKAIADYNKAIALKPNFYHAYNNRGLAYSNTEQYDWAIKDFNYAIMLYPKIPSTYNNRGLAYSGLGKYDLAIDDFSVAISLKPDYIFPYVNRARAYRNRNQFDKAIEDFDTAIKIDPNYAFAYYYRALTYKNMGQFGKAAADFKKNCELGDSDGCSLLKSLEEAK